MRLVSIRTAVVTSIALALAALTGCASQVSEPGEMTMEGLTPTPENRCLLDGSGPSGLPSASGDFVFDDGTAATQPPELGGGDPSGDWKVEGFTLYLPSVASGLVNPELSSIGGQAWLSLDSSQSFQMAMDIDIDIVVGSADSAESFMEGTVSAGAIGSYSMSGNTVTIADECFYADGLDDAEASAGGEADISRQISFERTGSTGRFLVTLNSDLGSLKLLVRVSQG